MDGSYQPAPYTQFVIHEPKRRVISAAAFRDRVVHHALCEVIEPRFERVFLPSSFANRVGLGTHTAVKAVQRAAEQFRYVLRVDVRQHFPSIDHQILLQALQAHISEPDVLQLIQTILLGGAGLNEVSDTQAPFDGDDLFSALRPRGLPIGNLTSQFWSNCYLHAIDLFVKRDLGCRAYMRYVDDLALFSHDKPVLWVWNQRLQERMARLRLRIHEHSAQAAPCACGIPWLGFVVYPSHTRIKARKVRHSQRHLMERYGQWQDGHISFGEFDASVQGWINHVAQADSWGLRQHVLQPFELPAGFSPHHAGRRKD